jgi:hypothetical protein
MLLHNLLWFCFIELLSKIGTLKASKQLAYNNALYVSEANFIATNTEDLISLINSTKAQDSYVNNVFIYL